MNDDVTVINDLYVEKQFPKNPFDNNPPWLATAFKSGFMSVVPLSEAYGANRAVIAVKKDDGTIQIAEVGDKIFRDDMFGLVVEKQKRNQLTWEGINKPQTD